MVATSNALAKIAAVVAGLGLVAMSFASFAVPAKAAMTSAEMEALIASLQAQLAALSGGSSSSSGSMTFTMDLTLGSSGSEVTALQNWLIGKGYSIPAGATGYFGAQTQAALAAYQAANGISPAAGYFGPITRAKVNAAGGTTGGGTTGGSTSGDLTGGAGSVDTYTLVSGLSSEKVGEDEEDVPVAGLEIENSDGSDIEIKAVKLVFNEGTADQDFDEYASEVSIWLDDEEVGRVDADGFNDDNSWTKTVSLDGAVIDSDATSELVVGVSGISNIDSADAGDTWTVDFTQVRFVDAEDTTVSEDPVVAVTTFSFDTFATANDVEMKVTLGDDNADGSVVNVDLTNDTDGVELLQFTIEADGSDLNIQDMPVTFTSSGANLNEVMNSITLEVDGEEYTESVTDTSTGASLTFDDLDIDIEDGDELLFTVFADINDQEGSFGDGDTLSASVSASNVDMIDAEDGSGENISNADATGTAIGNDMAFYDVGIMVTFVSADASVSDGGVNGFDGTGTFEIVFDVEAFDGDAYVSDNAVATVVATIPDTTVSAAGVRYLIDGAGTATADDLSTVVSFDEQSGTVTDSGITNGVKITEGSVARFTLTATRTNDNAGDAGLFRALLKAITWATTDAATQNVYDFDLEDYKTTSVSVN